MNREGSKIQKQEVREQIPIDFAQESVASEKHPDRNEDAVLINPREGFFGVFDGMGGHSSGEVASQTACDYVIAHSSDVSNGTDVETAKTALSKVIVGSDMAVREISEGSGMGTTAVVLKIHTDMEGKNWALIASVGDSRAYKISVDGVMQQLTVDDDLLSESGLSHEEQERIAKKIADAKDAKDLDEVSSGSYRGEGYYFRTRNQITRAVGLGVGSPNVYSFIVNKRDRFLITSDGVHDNLTTSEIEETINESQTPEEVAKNLVQKSIARSREPKEKQMRAKPDDMSAVVIVVTF